MKKFRTFVLFFAVAFFVVWAVRLYTEQYAAVKEAERISENYTAGYIWQDARKR